MGTIPFYFGLFCTVGFLGSRLPAGHLLDQQQRLCRIAVGQLGVREHGPNKGEEVEAYLHYTHTPSGQPWCASFVSWVHGQAGLSRPRTAWSPDLLVKNKRVVVPLPADVLGIYYPAQQRIAHCGLVEKVDGDWITSIEGNTNLLGGREGDGVYRKRRHRKTIRYFARWWESGKEARS